MWVAYALLSAFFAGLVSIFAKLGLKNVDSSTATAIRAIIMAFVLTGFVIVTGKFHTADIKNISTKDWSLILLSGLAGAISWLFYFYALKIAGQNTSQVAALDKLSLVFVAVFAVIVLKEKPDINTIVGVALMSVGAVVMTAKVL